MHVSACVAVYLLSVARFILGLLLVLQLAVICHHADCCQGDQDLFDTVSGRQSTISSVGGRDPLHEELRYMHAGDESLGGTLTPSTAGIMHDEYKYLTDERHRSHTPSLYLHSVFR